MISWPACFSFSTACLSARCTGGVGLRYCDQLRSRNPIANLSYTTMPSFQMTPNRNFLPTSTERQGIGKHFGSSFQGSVSTTFFAKNSMSSRLRAIGPLTELTASCPDKPLFANAVGNRPKDGLKVKMPVQAAGIRREPPGAKVSRRESVYVSTLRMLKGRLIVAVEMHSLFPSQGVAMEITLK
jgi:hypothetical protein